MKGRDQHLLAVQALLGGVGGNDGARTDLGHLVLLGRGERSVSVSLAPPAPAGPTVPVAC